MIERRILHPSHPLMRWRPKKPPKQRKNSEEYWTSVNPITSDTPIVKDQWLYHWSDRPPEPFLYHETAFRRCTPTEIAKHGWSILEPAVKEIGNVFGIQKPESKSDTMPGMAEMRMPLFEWLSLNQFKNYECLLGIHNDEYVVAAANASFARPDFAPFDYYRKLRNNKDWKNLNCDASYRFFVARFNTGYTFCTARQNVCCEVSYGLSAEVHSKCSLWAVLNVDGVYIPAPDRFSLAADLSDLPDKVYQMNSACSRFVRNTDTAWLTTCGTDQVYKLIRKLVRATSVPQYVCETLKGSSQLDRCDTRFDILREIMKVVNLKSVEQAPKFISLSQNFVTSKQRKEA